MTGPLTIVETLDAAEKLRQQYEAEQRRHAARVFTAARKRRRKITERSRKANRP